MQDFIGTQPISIDSAIEHLPIISAPSRLQVVEDMIPFTERRIEECNPNDKELIRFLRKQLYRLNCEHKFLTTPK